MFLRSTESLLRTVAFGPGPSTVLALNGWSAAWEAWQPTFEHLSTDTRCISYDTRGTGSSRAAAESITLATLVDDVFRVLDAHGVDRCVLTGESLGGFVALNAALRDPSRFTGLVTVAAPPVVSPDAAGPLVAGARADYRATIELFVRRCFSEPGSEHLYDWGEQLFLSADPEVAARLFECCYGVVPDLGAVKVPTVVVHGDADQVVPVAAGRFLASAIPGARLVELARADHAPTVTRSQEVAEVLREVCRAQPHS